MICKSYYKFPDLLSARQKLKLNNIRKIIFISTLVDIILVLFIPLFTRVATENLEKIKLPLIDSEIVLNSTNSFIIFLVCISLFLVSTILNYINRVIAQNYSIKIGAEVSKKLFKEIIFSKAEKINKYQASSLSQKIIHETSVLSYQVLLPLVFILPNFFLCTVLTILFLGFLPNSALYLVISLAASYILIYNMTIKKLFKSGKAIAEIQYIRAKQVQDSLLIASEIELHKKESFYIKNFNKANEIFYKNKNILNTYSTIPRHLIELICILSLFFILSYNYFFLNIKIIDVLPILSSFLVALFKFLPKYQSLYQSITKLKSHLHISDSLSNFSSELFNLRKEEVGDTNYLVKKIDFKNITLKNVSYDYSDQRNIINNVSLDLELKGMIALIGASGSGKTTILKLITGFIEPTKGVILVNGIPFIGNTKKAFRQNIAYVSQNANLINGTIKENIAIGVKEENIDKKLLEQSLILSGIYKFKDRFHKLENTLIGESGVAVSGGERKRILIARALYQNPNILILDEVTAEIDKDLTEEILRNLTKLKSIKAIILATHDDFSMSFCDSIYRVENHRIIKSSQNNTYAS